MSLRNELSDSRKINKQLEDELASLQNELFDSRKINKQLKDVAQAQQEINLLPQVQYAPVLTFVKLTSCDYSIHSSTHTLYINHNL